MRTFWKILLGGLVVFMALAITQQWGYFRSAWFGEEAPQPDLSAEDEASAVATVREVVMLLEHFYGTGGDSRFAERIPASPQIVSGFQADIEYLRRNRRRQEPHLQRLEVLEVGAAGPDSVRVRTREYWIHRIFWLDGNGEEAERPYSQVITSTYHLGRVSEQWRLLRMEMDTSFAGAGGEPAP